MRLRRILDDMQLMKALVIGDAIIDEYRFGEVKRLCPEAPVPVLSDVRMEVRQGGAANVMWQTRALGAFSHHDHLFGVPMSRKIRFMQGSQMLLRQDIDVAPLISHERQVAQFDSIVNLQKPNVIILSDYNKGQLHSKFMAHIFAWAQANKVLTVVDPKAYWEAYAGADWVCPNEKEWKESRGSLHVKKFLLKRGSRGLSIYMEGLHEPWIDVPAAAKHVFDVTGAGDTVVAVFALAMAAAAAPVEAARLANLAAGYVVGEIGTTVCPREKLLELVDAHEKG